MQNFVQAKIHIQLGHRQILRLARGGGHGHNPAARMPGIQNLPAAVGRDIHPDIPAQIDICRNGTFHDLPWMQKGHFGIDLRFDQAFQAGPQVRMTPVQIHGRIIAPGHQFFKAFHKHVSGY